MRAASDMNDPDLHLLVDDHEIVSYVNLERVLNRPRKHPEPVIRVEHPWEGYRAQAWGSVLREPNGLIRCWYFGFPARQEDQPDAGGYCYAESRDGIHFEKPELGIAEFRGSKKNNLWYPMSPDGKNLTERELARQRRGLPAYDENGDPIGVVNNMDGLTVVRDDDDPDPARRYKLVANMQDHAMWADFYREQYPDISAEDIARARDVVFGQYLDTSPDGIHWERKPRRMVPARYGDYMMVTRDERNRRWWLNERGRTLTGRNVALRTGTDFTDWSQPELVFDNQEESGFGRQFQWHGGMTPFNYGNQNLGLLEKWSNAGFGDTCELISQREGRQWERVAPGKPFRDIGPEGSFDRFLIYPTHNAPIRIGDELYLYYTGAAAMSDGSTEDCPGEPMAIGVATIRLDRFAGLAHRLFEPGQLLMRPMQITRPHIDINASPLFHGKLSLSIQRLDETPFEGFDFDDCQVNVYEDKIRNRIRWKNKADLSELIGQTAYLHFRIDGCILYSFRFAE